MILLHAIMFCVLNVKVKPTRLPGPFLDFLIRVFCFGNFRFFILVFWWGPGGRFEFFVMKIESTKIYVSEDYFICTHKFNTPMFLF